MINTTIGGVVLFHRPGQLVDEGIDEAEEAQDCTRVPSLFSHVGMCSTDGTVIEALDRVERNYIGAYMADPKTHLLIAHYNGFSLDDQYKIDDKMVSLLGQHYGHAKIGWQLVDAIASKLAGHEVTWWREHMCCNKSRPICSMAVEEGYEAVKYIIGDWRVITPEDIAFHVLDRLGVSWKLDYCDPIITQKLCAYFPKLNQGATA